MTTMQSVKQYIQKIPRGKPFITHTLLRFGSRAAVDQALTRLVSAGKAVRVARGIYVRPEENRFVGCVLPEPLKVVKAITQKTNEAIQVSGAEAARQLGLSTQVPTQPLFLTTGPSRQFKIGALEVTLKHVSKRKIPLPNSKAGLAILALWYLGKDLVSHNEIRKIEHVLTSTEFEKFKASTALMPAWMSDIVVTYRNTKEKYRV